MAGPVQITTARHRTIHELIEEFETAVVLDRLRHFRDNRTRTAMSLGLTREGLRTKMLKLGIYYDKRKRA